MIPAAAQQQPTAPGGPDLPADLAPADVKNALDAFTAASRRIEDYYQELELEVKRLTEDLERKNRELRRKVSEKEKMQAMLISTLQSLTCGVIAVGLDRVVVAANPAVCETFGLDLEQLAGREIQSCLPEFEGRERLLHTLLNADAPNTELEWTIEANGHRRRTIHLWSVRAVAPYDEHLAGLILTEDVTALRRLEQQAVVQSRMMGMGELAMNLAHEIRNPLGSIALLSTTLAHELADDPSLGSLAENLVNGVNSLDHVVTNVLEFARPRRLSMTRVNLVDLLNESIAFIEHPRAQKEIEIEIRVEGLSEGRRRREASVAGDPEQLRQVFLNLALNAIQAMSAGGKLSIVVRPHPGERWEVEFSDTGVGISPDDRERIFDPFFTTKEKGSGIGLALVHRIVTAHHAQIDVESEVGRGATFRCIFQSDPLTTEVV